MRLLPRSPVVKALLLLTILLGLLPYIPYADARLLHGLPSEAGWDKRGDNHGPWWCYEPQQSLIMLPMLALTVLPAVTLVLCCVVAVRQQSIALLWQALGLCAVQWGLAALQVSTVFWLVD